MYVNWRTHLIWVLAPALRVPGQGQRDQVRQIPIDDLVTALPSCTLCTQARQTTPYPGILAVELMLQRMHAAVKQEGQP